MRFLSILFLVCSMTVAVFAQTVVYTVHLPLVVKQQMSMVTITSQPISTEVISTATATPTNTSTATPTATATPTNTSTATPTATATPTNTPVPPIVVPNGGFESGREPWIFINAFRNEGSAHTGQWYAVLTSLFGAIIRQEVVVPISHPYLTFWHQTTSLSYSCNVSALVAVNGQAVATYTSFCRSQNSYVWHKQTIDLTAFAGQQVNLEFGMNREFETDPDDPGLSSWYVDDVQFETTP